MDANLSTIESSKGWRIYVVNDLEAYISCTKHWKLANSRKTCFRCCKGQYVLAKCFKEKIHRKPSSYLKSILNTLLETNISPTKALFEDDFPFPKVGYVNSLEGIPLPISVTEIGNPTSYMGWCLENFSFHKCC